MKLDIIKKENFVTSEQDILNAGYVTDELLPCPFCGNKKIITNGRINEKTKNLVYDVICTKCGANNYVCIGKIDSQVEARRQVVEKWNKRTI